MKLKLSVMALMFCLASGAACAASTTDDIPPAKLSLIKELLVASRTTANAKMGFDLIFSQEIKGIAAGVSARVDANPMLTQSQRAEQKKKITDMLTWRSERFKELLNQKINMDEAIQQVFIPMFNEHFTDDELKGMLAYYKSPVGQKSLDMLPQMSTEAATKLNLQLIPKMKEISEQINQEERDRAVESLKATPEAPQSK